MVLATGAGRRAGAIAFGITGTKRAFVLQNAGGGAIASGILETVLVTIAAVVVFFNAVKERIGVIINIREKLSAGNFKRRYRL